MRRIYQLGFFFAFILQIAYSNPIVCEKGLQSFEEHFYSLTKVRCSQCHGDGGYAIGHSVSDSTAAYTMALGLAQFPDYENSRFMYKVQKQHWLRHDPTAIGATVEEVLSALKGWWDGGERDCPRDPLTLSEEVTIPSDLPVYGKETEPRVLEFAFKGEDLENLRLTLEIQHYSDKGENFPASYLVRKPKLHFSGGTIHAKGLRVVINGKMDPYENIYATTDATFSPVVVGVSADHHLTLSSESMVVLKRAEIDKISLAFEKLEVIPRPICESITPFFGVQEILKKNSCTSCHNTQGEAIGAFPMSENPETLCRQIEPRMSKIYPENSILLDLAYRGKWEHLKNLNFEENQMLSRWRRLGSL